MTVRVAAALVASLGLATSAAAPGWAAAPDGATSAAECDAVRVVVDYNELGGADRTGCVPAGTAAEAFEAAGLRLEYVPQMQDFVCRVTGVPDDGPCSGADAYWSLWWSDGETDWTYASLGVGSLEVPAGGAVGFAWHEGSDDAAPPDLALDATGTAGEETADEDDGTTESAGSPDRPEGEDIVGEGDEGLPWWAVTLAAALVLAGALVPLVRRRRA